VRSFILILMIALLPLRMWAAEGMSTQMAAASSGMAAMSVTAMPADCPFMAAASQGDASGQPKDGTGTCAACQLCSAVAAPADFESAPSPGPRILAPPVTPSYQSALPLLADKPPIS
jgi:hypothetical protein